jgi:hypothetical protein
MTFLTIKDEEGIIRPMAYLWKLDENIKYHKPEIEKIIKRGECKLVEIELKEIGEYKI